MSIEPRRPTRQDTFDMRDQMMNDAGGPHQSHMNSQILSDEDHSILEDDSEGEDQDEFMDDDDSSSLSIPNESIDFDLVYSLHTFVATVEGQANVVKGDSLFLMDDSNSYWWLVRVLKTQEVGYIPAENIETPYERLARLNKHRNVDLAAATPEEKTADPIVIRTLQGKSVSQQRRRSVLFRGSSMFHYPPAVWNEEEHENWEDDDYESYETGFEPQLNDVADWEMDMDGDEDMEDARDDMDWNDGSNGRAGMPVGRPGQQPQAGAVVGQTRPLTLTQQQQQQREQLAKSQQSALAHQQEQLLQQQQTATLRQQGSREALVPGDSRASATPSPSSPTSPNPGPAPPMSFDPEEAVDTRKINVTPTVARDLQRPTETGKQGILLPSALLAQQREDSDEKKRSKEAAGSERSRSPKSDKDRKISKQTSREDENTDKKKKGVFGGLFGRKKDKPDKVVAPSNASVSSVATTNSRRGSEPGGDYYGPGSEEDFQQAPVAPPLSRNSTNPKNNNAQPPGHGNRVQQIDMQQQVLYQRYMESAAAAGKDNIVQPNYGLQSASAFLPETRSSSLKPGSIVLASQGQNASGHQRPGSLILATSGLGLEGGGSVPELSVMRVFAGGNLQTEATFKTVLLNSSTTASDLIKQAMQRFRVAAGEDSADYYLTVKTQAEGSFTTLQSHEKPLLVFEELVEATLTLPKIKRSSITSISSVSSNLSASSAIRKLPMNDFADDSAVKFYLNRYLADGDEPSSLDTGTPTAPISTANSGSITSMTEDDPFAEEVKSPTGVSSERFSAPSARFSMQVLIYPDDLPDGMVFDPHTEAIVPKSTLKDRTGVNAMTSPGIPQTFRRKVFVFPKNTTAAEVIEVSLERFGIPEGVVDGGDEIEDKMSKRRSTSRVRYGLSCLNDGQEKELLPSSKVLDAFERPPPFRLIDQRRSGDSKRRSADANQLLGSIEDILPDDPVFILRRAVAYRMNNAPRSRLSAPLDELALSHLQAQRESITASDASTNKDTKEDDGTVSVASTTRPGSSSNRAPPSTLSRQEIIAAQRAASRANQRAILSAQTNSEQGVDILLPDRATIRSSRAGNNAVRYSYIEPDGETYDISDIMEQEWSGYRDKPSGNQDQQAKARSQPSQGRGNDLLEGALGRQGVSENGQQALGEKIDRVLNKIKTTPNLVGSSGGRGVSAVYSDKDFVVAPPGRPERAPERAPSRTSTPGLGTDPVVAKGPLGAFRSGHRGKQGSVVSLDESVDDPRRPGLSGSPGRSINDEGTEEDVYLPPASARKKPLIVMRDADFGLTRMMAVIQLSAAMRAPPSKPKKQIPNSSSMVDDLLFGPKIDINELHPDVRDMYEPVLKRLDAMDKQIDELLRGALHLAAK